MVNLSQKSVRRMDMTPKEIKKHLRSYMRKNRIEALNWSRHKGHYERITRDEFIEGFIRYLEEKI